MRVVMELRRIRRMAPAAALLVALLTTRALAAGPVLSIARDPSGVGVLLPGSLWVSGDLTLEFEAPRGEPITGGVDDVSLLARFEPVSRFALFSELRLQDIVEIVEGEGAQTRDGAFVVERLYAELLLTPQLSLRLGKIFTPFGLWNVIDRAPLTWTVDQPAITEGVFPERATGVSAFYQTTWRGWSLDGIAYGPAQNEITVLPEDDTGLLFGTRIAAGRDLGPAFASLGVNAAGFRPRGSSAWKTATGLDLEVFARGHEITGEFTWRVPARGGGGAHGLYLQDAIPLFGKLYGVLRFEYFQPRRGRAAVGELVGLFWRPVPNVILKADYLFGTRRLENFEPGFQASFSLLF